MDGRLVLLHGWGANGEDLKPLGDRLARECSKTLDVVCLEAPEPHPDQPGGRQWYGLFPAQWDAVPAAVEHLKAQLQTPSTSGLGLERTVVFGFSQGGAMALDGGCALPIAGLISCSGYPHPNWAPPQQHPPVLLMHGSDVPRCRSRPCKRSLRSCSPIDVSRFHSKTATPSQTRWCSRS